MFWTVFSHQWTSMSELCGSSDYCSACWVQPAGYMANDHFGVRPSLAWTGMFKASMPIIKQYSSLSITAKLVSELLLDANVHSIDIHFPTKKDLILFLRVTKVLAQCLVFFKLSVFEKWTIPTGKLNESFPLFFQSFCWKPSAVQLELHVSQR